MTSKYNLYLGKAGQLYVMALFLIRGWNVATPEVDVGDDLLVIEDKKGIFYRIQVKTTQAIVKQKGGYSGRFKISLAQLQQSIAPEIYYALVLANDYKWLNTLLIRRKTLLDLFENNAIGNVVDDELMLYFSYNESKVVCSKVDCSSFLDNFDDFGVIIH